MDETELLDVVNVWWQKKNSEGAVTLFETADGKFFCLRIDPSEGLLRVKQVEVQ